METPKPQAGTWTLTAPDGRTWEASSPLHCASREQAERIPAKVAIDRIFAALLDDSNDAKDAARYRWLAKEHGWWLLKHFPAVRTYFDASEVIDESIDAAMR